MFGAFCKFGHQIDRVEQVETPVVYLTRYLSITRVCSSDPPRAVLGDAPIHMARAIYVFDRTREGSEESQQLILLHVILIWVH